MVISVPIFSVFEVRVWLKTGVSGPRPTGFWLPGGLQAYLPSVFFNFCLTQMRYRIIGPCIRYLGLFVVILVPIFSVFKVRVWLNTGVPGSQTNQIHASRAKFPRFFVFSALQKGNIG